MGQFPNERRLSQVLAWIVADLLLAVLCVLMLWRAGGCAIIASQSAAPPSNWVHSGCEQDGYKNGTWDVHAWLQYPDPQPTMPPGWKLMDGRWLMRLGMYYDSSAKKNKEHASRDCDRWLEKVSQQQQKENHR